jgi:nucleoside-diphosphate kinase
LGRFFNLAKSYQLSIGRVRTTSSTVSLHGIEFGAGDIIVETVGVNGADIEGFTTAASSLNPSGATMALNLEKIQDLMGLYVPIEIPDDCTLCLIKPHIMKDHVAGDVLGAIVERGFEIVGLHSTHFTPQIAEDLLDVYKGIYPQYSAMVEQLAESPLLGVMIMGSKDVVTEFRDFCGPLNPDLARSVRPDSLRAIFGKTVTKNAVHCTDLADDGEMECLYMFNTVASLEVQKV